MLSKIKMWLRCNWLAFCRDYKDSTSTCYSCGRYGASVVSLVYPKRLCKACEQSFQRRYHAYRAIWKDCEEQIIDNVNASSRIHAQLRGKL